MSTGSRSFLAACLLAATWGIVGYSIGFSYGVSAGRDHQRAITDNAWSQAREMKLCEFPAAIYQSVKCGNKP